MQQRTLIVGVDSLIGSVLLRQCPDADGTSRRPGAALRFDLAEPDFAAIAGRPYATAFICAAVTDMRACQSRPAETRRVNVDNTIELMRRLADRGTHLVFFSTTQVFDGRVQCPTEEAATNPRNEYGAQKRGVERAIARYDLPAAILRISKVMGDQPSGAFKSWRDSPGPITAATNLEISPVAAADAAGLARRLADGRHRGLWHFGAADAVTYAEAARLMVESQGRSPEVVGETLTEARVPAIYRLGNARLCSDKVARTFGLVPRPARAVLGEIYARW